MKSVRVNQHGDCDVLKIETVAKPVAGPNQVLVRVFSAGINPVDTYLRSGMFPTSPAVPYTPGIDGAGVVEQNGSGCSKFKVGERVFFSQAKAPYGAYAELCPVAEMHVRRLPDSLTFAQGASIGVPYYTAHRSLFHLGHGKANQTVLIHGASGAVGIAACQIAAAYGFKVFGTAGTDEGLELIIQNGASKAFNHRQAGYMNDIKAAAGGGVDLILEMVGNKNLQPDLELINPKGHIVVIGCHGPTQMEPGILMMKECSVTGVILFSTQNEEWLEMGASLEAGLASGVLKPVVGKAYAMDAVAQSHKDIMAPATGAAGKIVLSIP